MARPSRTESGILWPAMVQRPRVLPPVALVEAFTRGRGAYHDDGTPRVFTRVNRGTDNCYMRSAKAAEKSTIRLLVAVFPRCRLPSIPMGFERRSYSTRTTLSTLNSSCTAMSNTLMLNCVAKLMRATRPWCVQCSCPNWCVLFNDKLTSKLHAFQIRRHVYGNQGKKRSRYPRNITMTH